jgi:hypothetical protein
MKGFILEDKEPVLQPMRPVAEKDLSLVSRREGNTTWTGRSLVHS